MYFWFAVALETDHAWKGTQDRNTYQKDSVLNNVDKLEYIPMLCLILEAKCGHQCCVLQDIFEKIAQGFTPVSTLIF